MQINTDGSVATDLTGSYTDITAEHTADAWGRRQVTLTLSSGILGTHSIVRPIVHAKVNAGDLRRLAQSLLDIAEQADHLYAEHGARVPAGAHGS